MRVVLRPGASWGEQWHRTNASGTVPLEGAPLVVPGAEDHLDRNRFPTCAAAPVDAGSGADRGPCRPCLAG
jgi:transcriptional regulator of acetoin/glycerol metabolism